ncbi:MAG: hypothetical protein CR975_01440 [Gammaproteobacteria bacterium]|nr:MAG: hypothetical protein CR975_01440 [Gammaproteobacteria bacterium]
MLRINIGFVCLWLWAAVLTPPPAAAAPVTKSWSVNQHNFRAVAVSPAQISLHWKNRKGQPYHSFGALKSDLQRQGKAVLTLMNAGIYGKNDQPAGLHIEAGQVLHPLNTQRGKGNFHLRPNGVFFITQKNQARIVSTAAYRQRYANKHRGIRLATQSGPMLLINGKINRRFIASAVSPYQRNAVCTSKKNKVWFLITDSYTKTNLYTFAKAAKRLGCYQALYLDGSISKLYQRGVNSTFHFGHYVGILAVSE